MALPYAPWGRERRKNRDPVYLVKWCWAEYWSEGEAGGRRSNITIHVICTLRRTLLYWPKWMRKAQQVAQWDQTWNARQTVVRKPLGRDLSHSAYNIQTDRNKMDRVDRIHLVFKRLWSGQYLAFSDSSSLPNQQKLWKSNHYYTFLCVRARGCPDAWACAWACAHVALLIQHATRTRHIVFSFVASLAPPHSSTLSHKWHDFREKYIEHKMWVLFSYVCLKHFSFYKEFSEILL